MCAVRTIDIELENAAWYYPETMEKARHIKDYVAFCRFRPSSPSAWPPRLGTGI